MKNRNWDDWAVEAMERRSLVDPPEFVLRRAIALGKRRRRGLPAAWLSVAAMLAVVAIGAGWFLRGDSPALPTRPTETTVRSGEVETVSPSGRLAEVPAAFVWKADERASRYVVKLLAVDDAVLFEAETQGTELPLPAETSSGLNAAVTYAWVVEAYDAEGALVARSQRTVFEVRP